MDDNAEGVEVDGITVKGSAAPEGGAVASQMNKEEKGQKTAADRHQAFFTQGRGDVAAYPH